jgi:hypothetical protein
LRKETSPNAAGNTGFDEVAVPLEKRAIPIDLEGQVWSTSLAFHLDTPGYAPDASGHGYDGTFCGAVSTVEGGHFASCLLCPGGQYDFLAGIQT